MLEEKVVVESVTIKKHVEAAEKVSNEEDETVKAYNKKDLEPCYGRDSEHNVKVWKLKKLIKYLEGFRGRDLVSLIIPPCEKASSVIGSLELDDFIFLDKSRDHSFIAAITFARRTMESYGWTIPVNGLVLYAGTAVTDDGKEEEVAIQFEPFSPVKSYVTSFGYGKFHTKALHQLLECNNRIGFIIVDANGVLFGTLKGDTSDILYELDFSKDQSPESRLRKTAELATMFYVNPKTRKPNVLGLILAGPDDFVCMLRDSNMFDQRLASKILKLFHIHYGGVAGFNLAIMFSKRTVFEIQFTHQKELMEKCLEKFEEHTFVFGVTNTLKVLDMGAVESLVVWEDMCVTRYVLKNACTGEIIIKHLKKEQEADRSNFRDQETNAELEVQESRSLLEWFADEYKRFGCNLEFVTNKPAKENDWFICVGGMGALLRYPVDMNVSID